MDDPLPIIVANNILALVINIGQIACLRKALNFYVKISVKIAPPLHLLLSDLSCLTRGSVQGSIRPFSINFLARLFNYSARVGLIAFGSVNKSEIT